MQQYIILGVPACINQSLQLCKMTTYSSVVLTSGRPAYIKLFMGTNGWIVRGIHLAMWVYGYVAKDLVILAQPWSDLSAEVYAHMYSPLRFPCARGVYHLQASYDFVDMPRGDKGGWRASRRTWTLRGWRGGLDINMGERRKKRLCHTTLACIYMHIMEESRSLGYGLGLGPYDTVHGMPIVKLGRPGQPAR